MARLLSVCLCVVCSHFQTLLLWNHWAIEVKFHVEPPWDGGTKVCIWGPGHMTKVATMPIYGKNPSKIFSGTAGPICDETWYVASGTWAHHKLHKW